MRNTVLPAGRGMAVTIFILMTGGLTTALIFELDHWFGYAPMLIRWSLIVLSPWLVLGCALTGAYVGAATRRDRYEYLVQGAVVSPAQLAMHDLRPFVLGIALPGMSLICVAIMAGLVQSFTFDPRSLDGLTTVLLCVAAGLLSASFSRRTNLIAGLIIVPCVAFFSIAVTVYVRMLRPLSLPYTPSVLFWRPTYAEAGLRLAVGMSVVFLAISILCSARRSVPVAAVLTVGSIVATVMFGATPAAMDRPATEQICQSIRGRTVCLDKAHALLRGRYVAGLDQGLQAFPAQLTGKTLVSYVDPVDAPEPAMVIRIWHGYDPDSLWFTKKDVTVGFANALVARNCDSASDEVREIYLRRIVSLLGAADYAVSMKYVGGTLQDYIGVLSGDSKKRAIAAENLDLPAVAQVLARGCE